MFTRLTCRPAPTVCMCVCLRLMTPPSEHPSVPVRLSQQWAETETWCNISSIFYAAVDCSTTSTRSSSHVHQAHVRDSGKLHIQCKFSERNELLLNMNAWKWRGCVGVLQVLQRLFIVARGCSVGLKPDCSSGAKIMEQVWIILSLLLLLLLLIPKGTLWSIFTYWSQKRLRESFFPLKERWESMRSGQGDPDLSVQTRSDQRMWEMYLYLKWLCGIHPSDLHTWW